MNPWIVRNITYPIYERIKGLNIRKYQGELDHSQWLSTAELRKFQWIRLERHLRYCVEHIPYYRDLFQTHSLDPRQIQNFEDLRKIPVLTKVSMQQNKKLILNATAAKVCYRHQSSGSSGIPSETHSDCESESRRIAAMFRGRTWWGWQLGDRVVEIMGIYPPKFSLRMHIRERLFENKVRLSSLDLSDSNVEELFESIVRLRPQFLRGYVSSIHYLAQTAAQREINLAPLKIRGIITTAEVLLKFQKDLIESVFGCPVINEYGTSETGLIAFECPKGRLHLADENLFVEFLKDDHSVLEGEQGDIVVTVLNNRTMPLIRYRVGDVGSPRSGPCACGRGLSVMDIALGRENDKLLLKNGKRMLPIVFDFLVSVEYDRIARFMKQWKVIQKSVDRFVVQIVADPPYRAALMQNIEREFHKNFEADTIVEFEFMETIPPDPSGKRRFFVSEIKPDQPA
jgi:phenylacetate-CoA ligase